MAKLRIYIDACCFIELACYKVGTHKVEREASIAFLEQILQASYEGEIEVYTSTLSVAECQCAFDQKLNKRVLNEEIKQLFKDVLTSGQFVILIQDSVLVGERARNLYWVHQLIFSGADALHIASALELSCDEYLTFDDRAHQRTKELDQLGISVLFPKDTKSLSRRATEQAFSDNNEKTQGNLLDELENDTSADRQIEAPLAEPARLPGGIAGSATSEAGTQATDTKAEEKPSLEPTPASSEQSTLGGEKQKLDQSPEGIVAELASAKPDKEATDGESKDQPRPSEPPSVAASAPVSGSAPGSTSSETGAEASKEGEAKA